MSQLFYLSMIIYCLSTILSSSLSSFPRFYARAWCHWCCSSRWYQDENAGMDRLLRKHPPSTEDPQCHQPWVLWYSVCYSAIFDLHKNIKMCCSTGNETLPSPSFPLAFPTLSLLQEWSGRWTGSTCTGRMIFLKTGQWSMVVWLCVWLEVIVYWSLDHNFCEPHFGVVI